MKNKVILLTLVMLLGDLFFVSAIDVSVDNYYPTPVAAGDYFNIWLKVVNKDNSESSDVTVKLKPNYPFSVDPGDEGGVTLSKIPEGGFSLAKLKVRVDSGAMEGDNSLTFQYKDCPSCVWKEKTVSVTVQETQTNFDVVLQELSEDGVYLAIANIGKNAANAVTVRIPEQDDFKTGTISSSIVGNLESGDYTIVSFTITSKSNNMRTGQIPSEKTKQIDETVNTNLTDNSPESSNKETYLTVQIDYTDTSGIRRTDIEKIELDSSVLTTSSLSSSLPSTSGTMANRSNQTNMFKNVWFWGVVVLLGFIIGKEIYQRKKQKNNKK